MITAQPAETVVVEAATATPVGAGSAQEHYTKLHADLVLGHIHDLEQQKRHCDNRIESSAENKDAELTTSSHFICMIQPPTR